MRHRATPWARGSAAGLSIALAIALVSPPVTATVEPVDFEQLIESAGHSADAGQHAEALDAYTSAFEAMPNEYKRNDIGEFVVVSAAKAALADFEAHGDPTALERARTVLTAFIDLAAGTEQSTEAAEARLAEIDQAMPPPPVDESEAFLEPPPTEPEPEPPPARRGPALGLLVGGGAAVLAGVVLGVAGAQQVPWYEQKLADRGWETTDPGYDDQIAAAERVRAIDLGVGIGLAAVGIGLAVGGGVVLAHSKRDSDSTARASLLPTPQLRGGGLALRLEF